MKFVASKNSIKTYLEDSFYHIYNRGVEKRVIFKDQQDFSVFLSHLKTYLSPKDTKSLNQIISSANSSYKDKDRASKLLRLKNYSNNLELLCYALLPNHFHLLIRQKENVINHFMNSIGTRYGMYFNRKYKRTGILFQDVYKAILIQKEEYLLHLSRYIHLNPSNLANLRPKDWRSCTFPCSLPEYLDERRTSWINKNYILDYFSKTNKNNTYESFLSFPQDEILVSTIGIDYLEG